MNAFWFLTYRFFTRGHKGFLSFMTVVSMLGVAIGTASLITVISVMDGFSRELEKKILSGNPHIVIETGDVIENYSDILKKLGNIKQIKVSSAMVTSQVFLEKGNTILTVLMRGLPSKGDVVMGFRSYIRQGGFNIGDGKCIIGERMSKDYGYIIGDKLTLLSPVTGAPYTFRVSGIFKTGLYDYDSSVVIVGIEQAGEMLMMKGSANMIAVDLLNPYEAQDVASRIKGLLSKDYPFIRVRTWIETNKNLFAALKLEQIVMFLILTLIVIVASFNIASSLMVLVTDKTREIGILKALGLGKEVIYLVFLSIGTLIGVIGSVLGGLLGTGLCILIGKYKLISLPPQIYYIDHLPVDLSFSVVFIVFSVAVLISIVSALYPAARASRLSAIEAIRYE